MEAQKISADVFFQNNMQIIKKSIRDIKNSYNNYWDSLAELLQNSVDAIVRKNTGKGKIQILINAKKKTIKVKDDGIGIPPLKLDWLLNPFSSDKENIANEGGENGVGLSFVIFQCNDFTIKSRYINQEYTKKAVISNASTWCADDNNNDFCCNETMKKEDFEGTEVTIQKNDDENIFDLSCNQLEFLIRTKTAIGNVNDLFNYSKIDICVEFTFVDKSGKQQIKTIPFNYMTPIEKLRRKLTYDDVISFFEDDSNSDYEKREFIKNKIIYNSGTYSESGVDFDYWSCYMPDRTEWKIISKKMELISDESDDVSPQFKSCVTLSTKGMPTSIELPQPPQLGNAGYFPNFFIIINDDSYVPDIGRKAVSDDKRKIYNTIAKKQFNLYATKIAPFYKQEADDFDISIIADEIKTLPKIKSNVIKYKCAPHNQEAGVAAIFYELIGTRKAFSNFIPCYSAYRNKYDLYGYYNNKFCSIEFKYHLKNILNDFKTYQKMADEINYIVCWNVAEEDEAKINSTLKATITKLQLEDYDRNEKYMPEATHRIKYSEYAKPIYVIDLKEVVANLNKDERTYINVIKKGN